MKRAIVIIPTYNERANIERVITKLLAVFPKVDHWQLGILVVDDTSPDKTYQLVAELAKRHHNVHLVVNQKKSGLGGAYLKGMAVAFGELKADVIFEFDADLSHDPTKIPDFLAAIDRGADMVLGSRYIPGGGIPKNWGWHRKLLSVVGNWIIMTVLTNFSIRDWTTGYRAISRQVYQAVHDKLDSAQFFGYTFQIGFLYSAVKAGYKIVEVPFQFVDRTEGESKLGPEYIKNTLLFIFKVKIQEVLNHRIFKFIVVGGTGTLVQLISLQLFRYLLPEFNVLSITDYLAATFLSIEVAIGSNFLLNNLWTFADRKLALSQFPAKFLQFNVTSAGSILIQLVVAFLGEKLFGIFTIFTFTWPMILRFDSGTLYVVIGIILGLFWNFFAYNKFIWKESGKRQ